MDPLWNNIVVAGLQDGKPFLGTVTMLGVHYSDEHIATGQLQICTLLRYVLLPMPSASIVDLPLIRFWAAAHCVISLPRYKLWTVSFEL